MNWDEFHELKLNFGFDECGMRNFDCGMGNGDLMNADPDSYRDGMSISDL